MRTLTPALLIALFAAGCANSNRAGMNGERGDAMPPPMTNAQMMAALDADAEVLHTFITGNRGEIVTSEPFVNDFQSAEVRQYAQEMVTVHTATIQRAMALGMEPENNPVSARMESMAMMKADQLDDMEGRALDMAYINAQIELHTDMLNKLDNVLIPNADNAQLRALLTETRPVVAQHLEHAQRLHQSMM